MLRSRSLWTAAAMLAAATVCMSAVPETRAEVAPEQRPDKSSCIASHRKTASPSTVLLGEPVTITLSVQIACTDDGAPLHIVLVIDDSPSMSGARLNAAIASGRDLVGWLDLAAHPATRIGVVSYNAIARTRCQLTNDSGRATSCISELTPGGSGTRLDLALEEAVKVLRQGRAFAADRDGVREVVLLVTDGENWTGCAPAVQAADMAKGQGIAMYAVSLGPDADRACAIRLASSPAQYFEARQTDQLAGVFQRIHSAITDVEAGRLAVTDSLPENMLFLPDSPADPSDPAWDPINRVLTWHTAPVARAGVTHTFQVWPLAAGTWPTNVEATGEYLDLTNAGGSFTFDVPRVTVLEPFVPPTPTSTAPAPTAAPTAPVTPDGMKLFLPRVPVSHRG